MSCPFFVPTSRCDAELWPHRSRLPLGDGFCGTCSAPGHQGHAPADEELKNCNLGYAHCSRLPEDREADSVRFAILRNDSRAADDTTLDVQFAVERAHAPVASGILQWDASTGTFTANTAADFVTRLAGKFVASHLASRGQPAAASV